MMYLSLIKLRSFIAVGENLSFRIASEKLNLSQPAVSAHVKDLEESLGVPLLRRTTRSVKVTPEGGNFLIRTKRALDELEDVVLDLKEQAALRRGRLSVGCVPSIASTVLPVVLSHFAENYPDIRIQVYDDMADKLYQRTLNNEVDLMVGPISPQRNELDFHHLFDDQYVAIMPKDHPLTRKKSVTISNISAYPLLLLTAPTNVRIVLEKAYADAKQSFKPLYEASNPSTIGGMIETGLGITALPEMTMPTMMRTDLVALPITKPEINRKIGMLTRRGEVLSPAAEEFSSTLRQVAEAQFGGLA